MMTRGRFPRTVFLIAVWVLGTSLMIMPAWAQTVVQQQVDLSSFYNVSGIDTDGTASTNGFDGGGYTYSQTALSNACPSAAAGATTCSQTLPWTYPNLALPEGPVTINFQLGPANAPDAVTGSGLSGAIPLPAVPFATELQLLGAAVQGLQSNQTVVVNYTDGSNLTLAQNFGDWFSGKCQNVGESIALAPSYRLNPDGSKDNRPFYICLYNIAVDPGKTVASMLLPSNRNVVIVAATVVSLPGFTTAGTAPNPATITVGQSSQVNVTITSQAGYSGTVNLAYNVTPNIATSGATPPTITFSPTSVTLAPLGTATATMTFQAASAPKSAMLRSQSPFSFAVWLPIPALALAGFGAGSRTVRRKKTIGLVLLGLLLAAMVATPGCVSYKHLGNVGTPPGAYTVAITGQDSVTQTPQIGTGGLVTITVQ